ncbi:bifunctional diguanylate cyclase/phosphodiesterase [Shewanella sp. Scap07]|nr:bifunctional diguanylate cyclase/phosphodiesterase [Shewanella sp. Scap07]
MGFRQGSSLKGIEARHIKLILSSTYVLLLAIVFLIMFQLHQGTNITYFYAAVAVLLLTSRFTRSSLLKKITAILAIVTFVALGVLYPMDMEKIEEAFILIPLMYVILFPHSLWPIAVAFALLLTYLPSLFSHDIFDFVEDSLEIVVIATFASIMSLYQSKTRQQSLHFQQQSLTDDMTLLGNRKAFLQRLDTEIKATSADSNHSFILILLDLDNFKQVNDQYGHLVGDELLQGVATRLDQFVAQKGCVFRLSGDEFAMILTQADGASIDDSFAALDQQFFNHSENAFDLTNHLIHISMSGGYIQFHHADMDAISVTRAIDLALLSAKKAGKGQLVQYHPSMLDQAKRKVALESELNQAIELSQFTLVYQPKVSLISGEAVGAEALLRWNHPTLGAISPAEFIPIAEKTGLIASIGKWVLLEAMAQLALWQKNDSEFSVSINISAVQVKQGGLVKQITQSISHTGVNPHGIEFELTETSIMEQPERYIDTFESIRNLGCKIAIDDFGVAYSSLGYLTKLPIDVLKIDKSFIDDSATSYPHRMVVKTIVQLSQNLGLQSVAEGVETKEQRNLLREEGVDIYQGYYFSRPVSAAAITPLLNCA